MARSVGSVIQNNLSRGLITEATGLNFPENAVTDADNVQFEKVGRVRRRLGIDIESEGTAMAYEDSDGVIREYIWQSVDNTGGFTFLVQQIGWNIHFFEMTTNAALSAGIVPDSVDLRNFAAPGAGAIQNTPASFAAGNGYLFISHPYCDPCIVRFNAEEDTFEVARITILIRDFEGVSDGLSPSANPTTLTSAHHYNLKNQGWHKYVRIGTRGNEIAAGSGSTGNEQSYPITFEDL